MMLQGKKYKNEDIIYVTFKKHYCPYCETKLKTEIVKKVLNHKSPGVKQSDFWIGPAGRKHFITGDVEFSWKEFKCPNCSAHFTIEEMKKIEGIYSESTPQTEEQDKKWHIKMFLILGAIFICLYVIYYLFKFVI